MKLKARTWKSARSLCRYGKPMALRGQFLGLANMRNEFRASDAARRTVLRAIHDSGEIISSDLRYKLPISESHAFHIVAELLKDGTISRRKDGRKSVYSIRQGVVIDFDAPIIAQKRKPKFRSVVTQAKTRIEFTQSIERIRGLMGNGLFRRAITELNNLHGLAVNENDAMTLRKMHSDCFSKIKQRPKEKSTWFFHESER